MSGLRFKDINDFFEQVPNAKKMMSPEQLAELQDEIGERTPVHVQIEQPVRYTITPAKAAWLSTKTLVYILIVLFALWLGYQTGTYDAQPVEMPTFNQPQ